MSAGEPRAAFRPAATIDEVLDRLDEVIERARIAASRRGYFPALYRKVTASVQAGIRDGVFDDGERMERLDVVFANRYLEAVEAVERGARPTRSWQVAFDADGTWRPIVLQHLLLGMNAHINLDLGIAAARTAPGPALEGLHADFNRINQVLARLVDGVRAELATVWPPLRILDRLAGETEDEVINFSMTRARDRAWECARRLAPLAPADQEPLIDAQDLKVSLLGRLIWRPGPKARMITLYIRLRERGSVPEIIDLLG